MKNEAEVKKYPTDQYKWIYQIRYSLEPRWGFLSLLFREGHMKLGGRMRFYREKELKPYESVVNQLKFKVFSPLSFGQ